MNIESLMLEALDKRKKVSTYRTLNLTDAKLVDFTSNDYLGLNHIEFSGEAALWEDNGAGGSRLLSGNKAYHQQAEVFLSKFFNAEAALLYNSGYIANLGILSCVPQKGDAIFMDELSHMCIKEGVRLSRGKYYSFKHNDLKSLEQKLNAVQAQNKFIVVESVYSMDGDISPLKELVELAKAYNAYVIVDEAHSTGLYGKTGNGMCCDLGIEDDIFARIHTFGKAVGAHGAIVVGSDTLINFLINYSRQFIYTTALPSHNVATVISALKYRENNHHLWSSLEGKIKRFRQQINPSVKLLKSSHPIQGIVTGSNESVIELGEYLKTNGFDIRPVVSPTVPLHTERVRICLHSFNTDEEIDRLASTINKFF